MPGYRSLPQWFTGSAADTARAAESLHRSGDPASAARAFEEALEASLAVRPELPGWLCGRLAVLYRTMGRLEDEVHLLERYRASQPTDEARTRFEARLSKARALLARSRAKDNGALASVRQSLARRRRTPKPDITPVQESLVHARGAQHETRGCAQGAVYCAVQRDI